jgi:biopolymer transport protein ExbD
MIRRRKRVTAVIPVAAMSDIAFLLIIFFMVTSNFIKEAHVKVNPPASADVQGLKESQVSVAVDVKGAVYLQGRPCPVQMLGSAVSALLAERKDKVVTLKVDRDLKKEGYGPVLMALSDAGAEIALVGTRK